MGVRERRTQRRERELDEREVEALTWAWRESCEGAELCTRVDTPTGPTVVTPRLEEIVLGPPTVLTARLLPGQLLNDVCRAATRMAPHLGAVALRVEPLGLERVRVELLAADPLDGLVSLALPPGGPKVNVGHAEHGSDLREDWANVAHAIVQGVTRSGKSVWTYGLLAQLAWDRRVTVAGCDPTGLLFRPFAGSRHAEWQVSGVADPTAHLALLGRLVDEMDQRIATLPEDRDTLEIRTDPDHQMRVVVLEELAGLYRAVDALDKDSGKRVRALIARLLAEGAKVGIRVVIIVQRAEASIVGSFERAMCSLRISFRTDNQASVELLHPGAAKDVADRHTTARPGIALMSAPGQELVRFRGPYLGGYAEYVEAVRQACAADDGETGPTPIAA